MITFVPLMSLTSHCTSRSKALGRQHRSFSVKSPLQCAAMASLPPSPNSRRTRGPSGVDRTSFFLTLSTGATTPPGSLRIRAINPASGWAEQGRVHVGILCWSGASSRAHKAACRSNSRANLASSTGLPPTRSQIFASAGTFWVARSKGTGGGLG